jgi:uncharacterized protein YjiK
MSKLISSLTICLLVFLAFVPIIPGTQSQTSEVNFYQVRSIEIGKLGIEDPSGLAYSPDANVFIVADSRSNSPSKEKPAQLATIKLFEEKLADAEILPDGFPDSASLTFEEETNSFYIFNQAAQEMFQVQVSPAGQLDISRGMTRFGLRQLGLTSVQGVTIDPREGRLFILDSAKSQIVHFTPDLGKQVDGELSARDGTIQRINLNRFGPGELSGLAFNASTHHLYVLNGSQRQLYELTETGQVISVLDLSDLHLLDPRGMIFAPNGDPTDDPASVNLYIVDRRPARQGQASSDSQIVEVSLTAAASVVPPGSLPTTLVNTVLTSIWSPPSPDPGGISYLPGSNRLLVSDSEVDKMPPYFTGKNVYISTLSGSLEGTCSTIAFSEEPTGVAENPGNGHIFFSDDHWGRVFEVNPGADGSYCTADDRVTYISTKAFNSYDPEGVAYGQGKLFVADGEGKEVYVVDPGANSVFDGVAPAGDDQVTHFDTSSLNLLDPEGIEYRADQNTLLIVASTSNIIAETTLAGTLVHYHDISFLVSTDTPRSGLAYGPGSQGPSGNHVYLVSRGIDNGADPNENDGRIFEIALSPLTVVYLPIILEAY